MIKNFPIYYPLYQDKEKFIILVTGGRGSGKSYATSAFIERLTFEMTPIDKIVHQILYTRYTMVSAHMSVIPEFMEKVEMDGTEKYFSVTKTDVINKMTKSRIMFRGIKVSSGVQTAKLKSIHGITTFVCDEAEEWTNEQDFEKIMLSIRQKGIQNRIIIIMNPTDSNHFIYKKYIENTHRVVNIDGVDVQISTHPNVLHIHTTYFDNYENLSPEFIKEVESIRENNPEKYAHTVIGRWADVAEGAIYKKWGVVKDFPQWCNKVSIGLDFGFTHDETAIVRCGVVDNDLYIDEICYKTQMLTKDIIQTIKPYAYQGMKVIADSADPRLIQEIHNGGIRIYPVEKGAGSVVAGIEKAKEFNIFVTERSYNLQNELRKYVWDKDKDGRYINQPADGQADHLCFVGDTLVATNRGEKRIDHVKIGDEVLTSNGWKSVTKVFQNGRKTVLRIRIFFSNFMVEMEGTPDHKIKTKRGWKELQMLTKGDVLYLCKSSMVKPITNMQVRGISQGVRIRCIETCGNTIMEQSPKGIMSTILTKMHRIMIYPILNCLMSKLIYQNTCKSVCSREGICKGLDKIWTMQECLQANGTVQKLGMNGMLNMGKMLQQTLNQKNSFVSIVGKNMNHSHLGNIISVLTSAKRLIATIAASITKCVYVRSAEKNLLPTNIQEPNIVAEVAQEKLVQEAKITAVEIVREGLSDTFDIEVEDMHEFFANGILVHNCDAFRYYVYGVILGKIQKPKDLTGIFR